MNEEQKQYVDVCQPQFKAIFENMARKDEQQKIGTTVDKIHAKLFEDNGKPSLMTRVALLEKERKHQSPCDSFVEHVKDHREKDRDLRTAIINLIVKIAVGAVLGGAAVKALM
jgi:hypothetical protein